MGFMCRWRNRRRFHGGKGKNLLEGNGETTLKDLLPGEEAQIDIVPNKPLLPPLGFRKGKRVKVWAREQFGGPLIVEIDGRKIALARKIAHDITILNDEGELQTHETC